jgi:hypothetical protein
VLPDLLSLALGLIGASGIVGTEVFVGRAVGYFPRRKTIILG